MKHKPINLTVLILIAILAALSAVLMTINIPLPFAPTFLKFDIAEFPGLFVGFFIGPGAGVVVVILKNLIKLFLQGSETMFVGELMNIIGSLAYTLPASFIYKHRKDVHCARVALFLTTIIGSCFAIGLNLFIAFPMYASVYGIPLDAIIEMGSSVNPLVDNMFTLMLFGVLPFNLIKLSVTSIVTWWLYKRVGNYLRTLLHLQRKATNHIKGVKQ